MARLAVGPFLERFVLPLVRGGELHVGRPLGLDDVARMELELPHASVQAEQVDDARADVLAPLVARVPPLLVEADDLALAAGLHNALFLVHPDCDGVTVTESQRRRLVEVAQLLVTQPMTRSRSRVLARHGLLHNLFALGRQDTVLRWWTGSARFLGQPPPARLRRWRAVRRVREEVGRTGFDDLVGAPDVAPAIAMLLRRSPLTQLVATHPTAPALHWEDAAFVLRDAELARAVAYAAIAPGDGDDPLARLAVPARLAAAFEQMLERSPPPADVRVVAASLVHLNALLVLGERGRDAAGRSGLAAAALASERAAQRPRGLVTFYALPGAVAAVEPRLATPPGMLDDPELARRWQGLRAQVEELVGRTVVEAIAERLARHLAGGAVDPRAAVALPAGLGG